MKTDHYSIHGLDRHRRYIYNYTVVLQKAEESSRTEQNIHSMDVIFYMSR